MTDPFERVAAGLSEAIDSSVSRIKLPPESIARAAMRRGTRLSWLRRAGVGLALVGVALGMIVPLRLLSSLDKGAITPGSGSIGHGIGVNLPAGWEGYTYYGERTLGPVLRAANFLLPDPDQDFYAKTRTMPEDGIVIAMQEFVDVCGCIGFEQLASVPQLSSQDFVSFGDHAFVTRTFSVDDDFFALYVEVGSNPVPQQLIDESNAVLATVSLGVEPLPSPTARAGRIFPAPEFRSASGWNTASMAALRDSENVPIAWAANEPFHSADLETVARDGTLPFRPDQTLVDLSETGVVIVASFPLPNAPAPQGNPNFPDRELPLKLSDAEARTEWEGQVAPNVPEYLLWARVNGKYLDVRVYFGTLAPSASTLAVAQDELDRLTVPDLQASS